MARPRNEKIEHISAVPLFARLNQKELRHVAKHADEVTVPEGRVLAREDRPGAKELLVVIDGKLRVERRGKTIATMGPGDVAGEMSLLDNKPYSATVTAATDASLLVIGARSFTGLLKDVPGLKDKIMLVLVERLRAADERLVG